MIIQYRWLTRVPNPRWRPMGAITLNDLTSFANKGDVVEIRDGDRIERIRFVGRGPLNQTGWETESISLREPAKSRGAE